MAEAHARIDLIRRALGKRLRIDEARLVPLPDTGLAHDHIRIQGTDRLLRVPKQSQLALPPAANLAHQAAAFARCARSGHAPKLFDAIAPGPDLPMGALVVAFVAGRPPRLPDDLDAIAEALAAIHALDLPKPEARPPLRNEADPLAAVMREIEAQAIHLDHPAIAGTTRDTVESELADMRAILADAARPPVALITFDAHPGNFLIDASGRATIVDIEKARYGAAGFDLAHATLYTSTTWDVATSSVLTSDQVAGFYRHWLARMPERSAAANRRWLLTLRRMMWLWSTSWCAKWLAESVAAPRGGSTENWSHALSDGALVDHVAGRVADYLAPATVAQIRSEWHENNALTELLKSPH
jgi:hypothetical protein